MALKVQSNGLWLDFKAHWTLKIYMKWRYYELHFLIIHQSLAWVSKKHQYFSTQSRHVVLCKRWPVASPVELRTKNSRWWLKESMLTKPHNRMAYLSRHNFISWVNTAGAFYKEYALIWAFFMIVKSSRTFVWISTVQGSGYRVCTSGPTIDRQPDWQLGSPYGGQIIIWYPQENSTIASSKATSLPPPAAGFEFLIRFFLVCWSM